MLDPMRAGSHLTPYTGERLLAWLPHGASGRELVIGPPHFGCINASTTDRPADDLGFPAALVRHYSGPVGGRAARKGKGGYASSARCTAEVGRRTGKNQTPRAGMLPQISFGCAAIRRFRRQSQRASAFNPPTLPLGALLGADRLGPDRPLLRRRRSSGLWLRRQVSFDLTAALLYPGIESRRERFCGVSKPAVGSPAPVSLSALSENGCPKLRAAKWLAG